MTLLPLPPGPPKPPTPASAADRADFDKLVDTALFDTRASAEKWRTGLAALVTLATTALFIKGPESVADLPGFWRYTVPALLIVGLASAVAGLWLALGAASGTPTVASYGDIVTEYGSVKSYEVAAASIAANQLQRARKWVMVSLTLFLLGLLTWWCVPSSSTPKVTVSTSDAKVCGTLLSADQSTIRLTVTGQSSVQTIPFAKVANISVTKNCG